MNTAIRAVLLCLALAGCVDSNAPQAGATPKGEGGFVERNGHGLDYHVYVPGSYTGAQVVPLVVFLHGCNGDAMEQATVTSGWSAQAEAAGFIAVFPQAPPPLACWWFTNPVANSQRDGGEPAAIAGITQDVIAEWNIDRKRVWLDGYSAGGTLTAAIGATWPDLYAAIGMVEGCPYMCADATGELAYRAMGEHARPLPVFMVSGTAGGYVVGGLVNLQQWLSTDDLADDGELNGSVARGAASSEQGASGRGLPYTVDRYNDAAGRVLIEQWVMQGMTHEYPEPGGDLPDATAGAWAFFQQHPFE